MTGARGRAEQAGRIMLAPGQRARSHPGRDLGDQRCAKAGRLVRLGTDSPAQGASDVQAIRGLVAVAVSAHHA